MQTETTEVKKNILERVWSAIEPIIPDAFKASEPPQLSVFKGVNGKYYWHARHSNNFQDRDKEILSEPAHEAYVRRLDLGLVPMPELWSWHTEGTRQGQAEIVFYDNHIMNAVGTFDDTPEGEKARKYYERNAGKIELSHGFTFPKWALKDGIYEVYNTFEISTLPVGAAANPYTTFQEITTMAMSEEKRQHLEATIGKDRTDQLLSDSEKMGKAIEELGAKYKDFADVPATAETEAPVEGETPATEEKPKLDAAVFAQLLSDMLEGQAHVLEVIDAQGKAIKAIADARVAEKSASTAQVTALKTELDKLRAELALTPRRASEAKETQVDADKAAEILGQPAQEQDSWWKV
jgi:hypothetical protein